MNRNKVLRFFREDRVKLATVSGVLTTNARLIEWLDTAAPAVELITTKSYEVRPNAGYREPVLVEPRSGCFGNAVGLRNPGMERGRLELEALRGRRSLRALLNVSLSACSAEDFVQLAWAFEGTADLLELNFSCPHARGGYGAAIGSRPELVAEYVRAIRAATRAFLLAKLTPNVEDIGAIARAAVEAGADGIAAINTVGPEVFREPLSGQPVLYNPNGHLGGRSGEWVLETALARIGEIRRAVGPRVPLLGMGGVTGGGDVRRMRAAGADVVGVGSALIRVERQDDIPRYLAALQAEAAATAPGGPAAGGARAFLARERLMEYRPHRLRAVRRVGEGLRILTLDGSLDYGASQYVFLFLPGVGEKPFSIAHREPLSFLVRRKGEFTRALFALEEGGTLFVRGVYGAEPPLAGRGMAVVVAGGTGVALVPRLVERLKEAGRGAAGGCSVQVFFGTSSLREVELGALLSGTPSWITVADDGVVGRVIEEMRRRLAGRSLAAAAFYNIGPHPFMIKAMAVEERLGADPRRIWSSLESRTLCGVGACGACACGDRLLCKEGTFVSQEFLRSRGIDLLALD